MSAAPRHADAASAAPTEARADTARAESPGQQRTALVSVFAAGLLVALKLGTGLVTGSLG